MFINQVSLKDGKKMIINFDKMLFMIQKLWKKEKKLGKSVSD